ncbi:MAG: alpha/beta fold hydrolase, partial [Polyangiaceae bacterium]|nr:alpha/beta fold hydrolase [Polyangiaceae bacterium]
VRIDMPGFGESPEHPEHQPGSAADAALLIEVIAALQIEQPVLVAHSMGGAVAVRAATEAPSRVAGLALLAVPGLSPHQHLRRIPVRPISRAFRAPAARRLFAPLASRAGAAAGFPRSIPVSALYRSVDWAASYDPVDHAARCRRITQPCLLAYAADDVLVEPAIGDALGDVLPSGPRLRFSSGGHNVQKTQAVAVGEALIGFLDAMAPRAVG